MGSLDWLYQAQKDTQNSSSYDEERKKIKDWETSNNLADLTYSDNPYNKQYSNISTPSFDDTWKDSNSSSNDSNSSKSGGFFSNFISHLNNLGKNFDYTGGSTSISKPSDTFNSFTPTYAPDNTKTNFTDFMNNLYKDQKPLPFQVNPTVSKTNEINYSDPIPTYEPGHKLTWGETINNALNAGIAQNYQHLENIPKLLFGNQNTAFNQSQNYLEDKANKYQNNLNNLTGIKNFVATGLEAMPEMLQTMVLGGVLGKAAEGLGASQRVANAVRMLPFSTQAGAGYAREAENDGASLGQQLAYGTLGGLAEGLTEKPIVTNWMDLMGGKLGKSLINQGGNTLLQKYGKLGAEYLKDVAKEAFQEAAVDPLTGLAKKLVYKHDMNWTGKDGVFDGSQMTQDAYGGAAMSVIMAALGLPSNLASHKMASKMVENKMQPTPEIMDTLHNQLINDVNTIQAPQVNPNNAIVRGNTTQNTISPTLNIQNNNQSNNPYNINNIPTTNNTNMAPVANNNLNGMLNNYSVPQVQNTSVVKPQSIETKQENINTPVEKQTPVNVSKVNTEDIRPQVVNNTQNTPVATNNIEAGQKYKLNNLGEVTVKSDNGNSLTLEHKSGKEIPINKDSFNKLNPQLLNNENIVTKTEEVKPQSKVENNTPTEPQSEVKEVSNTNTPVEEKPSQNAPINTIEHKVNDEVTFNHNGKVDAGTISKVNKDGTYEIQRPEGDYVLARKNGDNFETIKSEATPKEQIPLDDRTEKNVGNRKIKAYQYLHPELKHFIQKDAENLLGELRGTVKADAYMKPTYEGESGGYQEKYQRTQRVTSNDIAYLRDHFKMSYEDIEKGLNKLIQDNGEENNAASKKIELVIDSRLTHGFTDSMGNDIKSNKEYIAKRNEIEGTGQKLNTEVKEEPKEPENVKTNINTKQEPSEINKSQSNKNLSDYGLTIKKNKTKNGNNVYEVTGNTKPYKEIFSKLRARWYSPKKSWSFYTSDDPTENILNVLPELKNKTEEKKPEEVKQETNNNPSEYTAKDEVKGNKESQEIANRVQEWLKAKHKFTSDELFKAADEAYNGTMADGKYDVKSAFDSMELGVNQYLLNQKEVDLKAKDTESVKNNIKWIKENVLDLIPTQYKRTDEQVEYQQFSTPPTIGYLVNWIANVGKNDTVLEPSAGIGGLAVFAKIDGAKVVANELSERRLDILKNMNFDEYYNENAEQIDNILPDKVKPTIVEMNPPFSSTQRMKGKNDTKNATMHIEQALNRLEYGGRLVAIVGQGMSEEAATFKNWWKDIKSKYNVRANVGLGKSDFVKYGTGFGTQIFVIDKTGPTTEKTITGEFNNLNEIIDRLEVVQGDKQRIVAENKASEQPANKQGSIDTVKESKSGDNSKQPVSVAVNELGDGNREKQDSNDKGLEKSNGNNDNRIPRNDKSTESNDNVSTARTDSGNNEKTTSSENSTDSSGLSNRNNDELNDRSRNNESNAGNEQSGGNLLDINIKTKEEQKSQNKNDLGDSVYSDYEPQKLKMPGAKAHPGKLAQSAAMAAVEPPNPTYKPDLPKELIDSGRLSIAQLETTVYAGQAHEQILPNGERKGFFIGDGTGVGKGRELSSIILDNFRHGRKKAVWISKNAPLYEDAQRDWSSLGQNVDDITNLSQYKVGTKIDKKDGIVFTTYGTIGTGLDYASGGKKEGIRPGDLKSRVEQIVDWVGKDFDGVIVFDEAHQMANAGDGKNEGTKAAQAGILLQKRLPNARIVYASATGATDVSNLAYANRLGLWGTGTAFANVDDFISKIEQGGLAAMELVSRDMKSMGSYISRNLSYDGVDYENLTHNLTKDQKGMYDTTAKAWQIILQNMDKALDMTNQKKNSRAKAFAKGRFWSANQRFFNQFMTTLSMPSVLEDMENRLNKGEAVVIQLVNTNQAEQERQLAKIKAEEGSLDDIDLSPKGTLLQYLDKAFPTVQYEEYLDDEGKKHTRIVTDRNGNPVENKEAVKLKNQLMEMIGSMKMPEGPIDMIINKFGVDNVAEITGRNKRVVLNKDGKKVEQSLTPRMRTADTNAFMGDKKRVLIFSDAGGTGRSYHAEKGVKNQRHRVHYLLQAGWEAKKAVQGFGRTHRSNESSAPTYVLVSTNLRGQKRFISTIARRLDQLGALTKGQRQAGSSGMFKASDNLENDIAKNALYNFYKNIVRDKYPNINKNDFFEQTGLKEKLLDEYGNLKEKSDELKDVPHFLNRILSLQSDFQNTVFDTYSSIIEDMTEYAKENGLLDEGLENLKADKIKTTENKNILENNNGVTSYHQLELWNKTQPVNFDDISKNLPNQRIGFYKNKVSNRIYAVYKAGTRTLENGRVIDMARLFTQEDGKTSKVAFTDIEKNSNYEKLKDDEASKLWDEAVSKLPEYSKDKVHLISGTLLPVWDRLPQGNMKVVRALTDNGDMLLGRVIKENEIDSVLRRLGTSRTKEKVNTQEIVNKVLNDNYSVNLVNGWKLQRKKVSGEYRIELVGNDLYKHREQLKNEGVFTEMIQYATRYFIPTGENASKVIDKITQYRPIDTVTPPENKASGNSYYKGAAAQNTVNSNGTGETKDRKQIIDDLVKELEIPVRTGRIRGKDTLGVYKNKPEVVRTKAAEDMPTMLHEIGHHLDKLFNLTSLVQGNKNFKNEMLKLGEEQAKVQKLTKEKQIKEGIAEFVRLYGTGADVSQYKFTSIFEKAIDKKLLKALQTFKDEYSKYINAEPGNRMLSQVSIGNKKSLKEKLGEKLEDVSFDKFYTAWIDELKPLYNLVKQGVVKGIRSNPYEMAWLFRGWAGKAIGAIKYGVYNYNSSGKLVKVSDGLNQILKPIKENQMDDFRKYIIAKRVIEKEEQGIHTGFNLQDSENIVKQVEEVDNNKEFIEAHEKLQTYQDSILRRLVDSGLMSEEQYKKIKDMNKDYVPFYRVLDNESNPTQYNGSAFGNVNNPVKKMKGGNASIIDPIESIVKNTYYFTNLAERNLVGQSLVKFAEENEGMGKYVENVTPKFSVTKFDLEEIKNSLENAGFDLENGDLENVAAVFRPIMKGNAKENIITVTTNGKPKLYQLSPELYNAVMFLDRESSIKIIQWMNSATRILRAGAVLNPDFAFRNMIRDAWDAMVYSKYHFIPVYDTLKGLFHVIKKDEVFNLWLNSGAAHSEFVSIDRDYLSKGVREVLSKGKPKELLLNFLKEPLGPLRALSALSEDSTRVGHFAKGLKNENESKFSKAINKLLHVKKEENTIEGLAELGLSTRDLTLDFGRFGTLGKNANKMIAFFNATVQGQDKMIRAFKNPDTRYMTLLKSLISISLPSLILWFMYHDDDKIKELPLWRKDLFWNIPTANHVISIPKPFELGIIFGSLPERILDKLYDSDPKAMTEWGRDFLGNMLPGAIPTFAQPMIEAWANKSFFTGLPIENTADKNNPAYTRYSGGTSLLAKNIGAAARNVPGLQDGLSPKMIDNTIQGYTGGLGKYAVGAIDKLLGANNPKPSSGDITSIPGIKGFFLQPFAQARSIDDFYNAKDEIKSQYDEAAKKYKAENPSIDKGDWERITRNIVTPIQNPREAIPTIPDDLKQLYKQNYAYGKVGDYLSNARKQEQSIYGDNTISAAVKQGKINQLHFQTVQYLKKFKDSIDSNMYDSLVNELKPPAKPKKTK